MRINKERGKSGARLVDAVCGERREPIDDLVAILYA
jgi:hypothetical protein